MDTYIYKIIRCSGGNYISARYVGSLKFEKPVVFMLASQLDQVWWKKVQNGEILSDKISD